MKKTQTAHGGRRKAPLPGGIIDQHWIISQELLVARRSRVRGLQSFGYPPLLHRDETHVHHM